MKEELISVVIPVYNSEKYLEDCIKSVISQSYRNLEIILVNDGSTDSSGSICQDYMKKDNRIRYIEKKNEGLSVARRTGIKSIKGDFFSTFDADDILEKDYVKFLHQSLIENASDIALCGRKAFDDSKVTNFPIKKDLPTCIKMKKKLLEKNFRQYALEYQMSDSWNKMYRTKFVTNSGVTHELNPKYNGTDLLFNHLLLLHEPTISTVHMMLYNYRIVKGSIVHRGDKPLQEGFECITKRLILEAEKLSYSALLKRQILMTYYGLLKYATLDIVEYNQDDERTRKLKVCVMRHCNFVKSIHLDISILDIFGVREFSLKIFFFLLKIGWPDGIVFYYKIRSSIAKIG